MKFIIGLLVIIAWVLIKCSCWYLVALTLLICTQVSSWLLIVCY